MRIHRFLLAAVFACALAGYGQQAPASGQAPRKAPAKTPPAASQNAPARQKLVMKDGSDQVVRSCERVGDRVRYFSIERGEWEEVPASLVDWKATEEANRADQAEVSEKASEAAQVDRAGKDEWLGPELAPGVRLPNNSDGLFVVAEGQPRSAAQAASQFTPRQGPAGY